MSSKVSFYIKNKQYSNVRAHLMKGGWLYIEDFFEVCFDSNMSLIELAAISGNNQMFKELYNIKHLNYTDSNGNTLLHLAAMGGSKKIVSFLLSKGFNINIQNIFGQNPLHIAARNGFFKISSDILKSSNFKADINSQDYQGFTPLHFASSSGSFWLTKLLLEMGASYEVENIYKATPLHWACCSKGEDLATNENKSLVAKLLISKIKDEALDTLIDFANRKNLADVSPIDWAMMSDNIDILFLLMGIYVPNSKKFNEQGDELESLFQQNLDRINDKVKAEMLFYKMEEIKK